jgi:asparagine synthase (glutamine-hydrolysing)
MPGRSMIGAIQAQIGAAFDFDLLDPTGEVRVLKLCYSIPDAIYIEPETGLDRWLIRSAMQDLLPDAVRLNRNRGRQAGDLVPRLRACANEVDAALSEVGRGPASEYLDLARLQASWHYIQQNDTPKAFHDAITLLTRGLMVGLFVNQTDATA